MSTSYGQEYVDKGKQHLVRGEQPAKSQTDSPARSRSRLVRGPTRAGRGQWYGFCKDVKTRMPKLRIRGKHGLCAARSDILPYRVEVDTK